MGVANKTAGPPNPLPPPGTEECLLFPSGFAANCSVMAAVAGSPEVEVFSDELNHASLVDGLRLAKAAGARVQVYRHNDMAHLESLLQASPAKPSAQGSVAGVGGRACLLVPGCSEGVEGRPTGSCAGP